MREAKWNYEMWPYINLMLNLICKPSNQCLNTTIKVRVGRRGVDFSSKHCFVIKCIDYGLHQLSGTEIRKVALVVIMCLFKVNIGNHTSSS